jgi:hypothetical protein
MEDNPTSKSKKSSQDAALDLEQEQQQQQQISENDPSRRRRVCLFGLSADPPTGVGGHYSIVQALRTLRRHQSPTNGTNGSTRDCDAGTCDSQSTAVAPDSAQPASTDGGLKSDDGPPSAPYMFDEVWVLPVYSHTFQVRCVDLLPVRRTRNVFVLSSAVSFFDHRCENSDDQPRLSTVARRATRAR